MRVVIDVNVLLAADGRADQAGPDCIRSCVVRLDAVRAQGCVVIDDRFRIVNHYCAHFRHAGQPGVGRRFLTWLLQNTTNKRCCESVTITPVNDKNRDFDEFPDDPDLYAFDRADQLWVAVARACTGDPVILNGTDRDWWAFRKPLRRHGVRVCFLCPELMEDR